jgi:hypothetical protein
MSMTYPHVKSELKARIRSVVVKEFGGIDHLPDDISALGTCWIYIAVGVNVCRGVA